MEVIELISARLVSAICNFIQHARTTSFAQQLSQIHNANFHETFGILCKCLRGRSIKGPCHGQKCLHSFSESEAYHGQMGPILSSNGSLDIALSNVQSLEPSAMHLLSAQQNWPRDRKLTQSCGCLHWFPGLRADVWKTLFQVYTRPVVTQVWMGKMFNKNVGIGFQSAVFHLCQRALVPLLRNDRGPNATASIWG